MADFNSDLIKSEREENMRLERLQAFKEMDRDTVFAYWDMFYRLRELGGAVADSANVSALLLASHAQVYAERMREMGENFSVYDYVNHIVVLPENLISPNGEKFAQPVTNPKITLDTQVKVVHIKRNFMGERWNNIRDNFPDEIKSKILTDFQNSSYHTPYVNELSGCRIVLTSGKRGLSHILSDHTSHESETEKRRDIDRYELVPYLPDLIKSGVLIEEHPDEHKTAQRIYRLFAPTQFDDGRVIIARLTLRKIYGGFLLAQDNRTHTTIQCYDIDIAKKNRLEPRLQNSSFEGANGGSFSSLSFINIHDILVNVNDKSSPDPDNPKPYINEDGTLNFDFTQNTDTFKQFDPSEQDMLGIVQCVDNGYRIITLMESANETTFMHEMGHVFLMDLENLAALGDETAREDLKTVHEWAQWHEGDAKKYAGTPWEKEFEHREGAIKAAISAGDELEKSRLLREWKHERFARGFEVYLQEGKAPTQGLERVFDRCKEFFSRVYHAFNAGGAKASPEVEKVMARMLARDGEKTRTVTARPKAKPAEFGMGM